MSLLKAMLLTLCAVSLIVASAEADLIRTFDSYHAFFVYGTDSDQSFRDTVRDDARIMQESFDIMGWDTHIYGHDNGGTNIWDALIDMEFYADPNELLFFYYSGHGGGNHPVLGNDGKDDSNNDESQTEDPLPPNIASDEWDETLNYDPSDPNGFITDDELGERMNYFQSQSAWVSGVIDACHSNGMLDGSLDISGYLGKESLWMTAATEWEVGWTGDPYSVLTGNLVNTFDPLGNLDQLLDFDLWFQDAALYGHTDPQTFGIKYYEEDVSSYKEYYPAIPEPATMLLLGIGLIGLAGVTRKKNKRGVVDGKLDINKSP